MLSHIFVCVSLCVVRQMARHLTSLFIPHTHTQTHKRAHPHSCTEASSQHGQGTWEPKPNDGAWTVAAGELTKPHSEGPDLGTMAGPG